MNISGLFPSSGIIRELVVKQLSPKHSGMALTPLLTMPRSQSKRPRLAPQLPSRSTVVQGHSVWGCQYPPTISFFPTPPLLLSNPVLLLLYSSSFHSFLLLIFLSHDSFPPCLLCFWSAFFLYYIGVTQRHPTSMESEVFVYKMQIHGKGGW